MKRRQVLVRHRRKIENWRSCWKYGAPREDASVARDNDLHSKSIRRPATMKVRGKAAGIGVGVGRCVWEGGCALLELCTERLEVQLPVGYVFQFFVSILLILPSLCGTKWNQTRAIQRKSAQEAIAHGCEAKLWEFAHLICLYLYRKKLKLLLSSQFSQTFSQKDMMMEYLTGIIRQS